MVLVRLVATLEMAAAFAGLAAGQFCGGGLVIEFANRRTVGTRQSIGANELAGAGLNLTQQHRRQQ